MSKQNKKKETLLTAKDFHFLNKLHKADKQSTSSSQMRGYQEFRLNTLVENQRVQSIVNKELQEELDSSIGQINPTYDSNNNNVGQNTILTPQQRGLPISSTPLSTDSKNKKRQTRKRTSRYIYFYITT